MSAAAEDSAGKAIRVWMELDLESNPIRGTLSTPGGSLSAFTGWLGLTTALDGMRNAPAQAEAEAQSP